VRHGRLQSRLEGGPRIPPVVQLADGWCVLVCASARDSRGQRVMPQSKHHPIQPTLFNHNHHFSLDKGQRRLVADCGRRRLRGVHNRPVRERPKLLDRHAAQHLRVRYDDHAGAAQKVPEHAAVLLPPLSVRIEDQLLVLGPNGQQVAAEGERCGAGDVPVLPQGVQVENLPDYLLLLLGVAGG